MKFLFGGKICTESLIPQSIHNDEIFLLKYLNDNYEIEKDEEDFYEALKFGTFETVIYLHENGYSRRFGTRACAYAARNKRYGLEILKWLRRRNPPCPWNEEVTENAVLNYGQGLEILKWARGQNPPCPWDKYICQLAEDQDEHGEEILEWIKQQDDCPC